MQPQFSRRHFIQVGAAGLGSLMFPYAPRVFARDDEPHFFVQCMMNGGVDQTYMFDARPLEMTAAGKLQNYLKKDPGTWTGSNGVTTLATTITDPFKEFKTDLTVINGVLMAHAFDGHFENMKYLFAGDPFGGGAYLAHLNKFSNKSPLDTIAHGLFPLPPGLGNIASTLTLSAESARALFRQMKTGTGIDTGNPWVRFIQSRLDDLGKGSGSFSAGSRNMLSGYREAPRLAEAIKGVEVADPAKGTPETDQFLPIISEAFRKGVAQSVILSYGDGINLDVHAAVDAKQIKTKLDSAVDRVIKLIRHLKNTPYDEKRSLLDMTTVMVSSEFSRTMRQEASAIDDTGTDHNSLNNSVLLIGKGIKGGQVFGGSDYHVSSETLSGAHKYMDPKDVKIMARPFDFRSMQVRTDKPEKFQVNDYLTFNSIANTMYSLFKVPDSYHRVLGRDLPVAPLLRGVLK